MGTSARVGDIETPREKSSGRGSRGRAHEVPMESSGAVRDRAEKPPAERRSGQETEWFHVLLIIIPLWTRWCGIRVGPQEV